MNIKEISASFLSDSDINVTYKISHLHAVREVTFNHHSWDAMEFFDLPSKFKQYYCVLEVKKVYPI